MVEIIRSAIFKIEVEVDTNKQTYRKEFVYNQYDENSDLEEIIKEAKEYFDELLED